LLLLHTSCAAPPNKEIGDALNALKSAKAAGADRFAAESYAAAADAYRLANEAVLDGDYRLALNRALESREHAQTAVRQAADVNIRARSGVHQAMTDVAMLFAQVTSKIQEAERAGTPRGSIANARNALAQVSGSVQEAGTAMNAEEFARAEPILAEVKERLNKTLESLEAGMPQSQRRPR
jgi:hypothetical protein